MSEWILVKEKVPDNNMNVLVTTKEGYLEIGFYDQKEGWCLTFTGHLFLRDPIAWMPAPRPYRE